MEKEKIIEEMRDKRVSELVMDTICEVDHCDKPESCVICKAEHLVDLGYRKIPDGAVVLTREEYIELVGDYFACKRNAERDTAIEILSEWKKELQNLLDLKFLERDVYDECIQYVRKLKSKYGV